MICEQSLFLFLPADWISSRKENHERLNETATCSLPDLKGFSPSSSFSSFLHQATSPQKKIAKSRRDVFFREAKIQSKLIFYASTYMVEEDYFHSGTALACEACQWRRDRFQSHLEDNTTRRSFQNIQVRRNLKWHEFPVWYPPSILPLFSHYLLLPSFFWGGGECWGVGWKKERGDFVDLSLVGGEGGGRRGEGFAAVSMETGCQLGVGGVGGLIMYVVRTWYTTYPTTNGGMQNGSSVEIFTLCIYTLHYACRRFVCSVAVLINKNFCIGAQSEVY